jgi:hypothetical protein
MRKMKILNKQAFSVALFLQVIFVAGQEIVLSKPPTPKSNCPVITAMTKKIKQQNPKSFIGVYRHSVKEGKTWANAPTGDSLDISIRNFTYDTEFQKIYSKKILNECRGIVLVSIAYSGQDVQGTDMYGLVDGRVKRFQCPSGMSIENHPFKWGHFCGA